MALFHQPHNKSCAYLSDVDPPKEGRVRRTPVRLDDYNGAGVMLSIKEKSHQLYMEVFDLAINGIKARFEQQGIELLLLNGVAPLHRCKSCHNM